MKMFAAKEAKNRFGALLDSAQREPVTIQKNGRAVAVLLSVEDYRRLDAAADAWWAERARQAAKDGFVGAKASRKLIRDMLNAEDRS